MKCDRCYDSEEMREGYIDGPFRFLYCKCGYIIEFEDEDVYYEGFIINNYEIRKDSKSNTITFYDLLENTTGSYTKLHVIKEYNGKLFSKEDFSKLLKTIILC